MRCTSSNACHNIYFNVHLGVYVTYHLAFSIDVRHVILAVKRHTYLSVSLSKWLPKVAKYTYTDSHTRNDECYAHLAHFMLPFMCLNRTVEVVQPLVTAIAMATSNYYVLSDNITS